MTEHAFSYSDFAGMRIVIADARVKIIQRLETDKDKNTIAVALPDDSPFLSEGSRFHVAASQSGRNGRILEVFNTRAGRAPYLSTDFVFSDVSAPDEDSLPCVTVSFPHRRPTVPFSLVADLDRSVVKGEGASWVRVFSELHLSLNNASAMSHLCFEEKVAISAASGTRAMCFGSRFGDVTQFGVVADRAMCWFEQVGSLYACLRGGELILPNGRPAGAEIRSYAEDTNVVGEKGAVIQPSRFRPHEFPKHFRFAPLARS